MLIDEENGIIAGHGRVLAAHLLGLDEVPCIVLAHLTPAQRRAYVLADNKLALNAGWDLDFTDSGAGPHSTWDVRDLCVQPSIPKD